MILDQDVYHTIHLIEDFERKLKFAPVAVRLPIRWVLSGSLPSSSNLVSKCFKSIIETEQESYGAKKEVDPWSPADRREVPIVE